MFDCRQSSSHLTQGEVPEVNAEPFGEGGELATHRLVHVYALGAVNRQLASFQLSGQENLVAARTGREAFGLEAESLGLPRSTSRAG